MLEVEVFGKKKGIIYRPNVKFEISDSRDKKTEK